MAYSEAFKAEALLKLAFNKNDYQKTADELGVNERTIRRWAEGQNVGMSIKTDDNNLVVDVIEATIKRLLENIPPLMNGQEWAISLGILIDKWLILKDKPTSRVETIEHLFANMPEYEFDSIVEEARAILEGNSSGDPTY